MHPFLPLLRHFLPRLLPFPSSPPSSLIIPRSPLPAVCHQRVITAFFTSSVTFLPSLAVLITPALFPFYLSVKNNLSSPHPFILPALLPSPDPSAPARRRLRCLPSLSRNNLLIKSLLGVISAGVPGSLGQYLLNYCRSDIAI